MQTEATVKLRNPISHYALFTANVISLVGNVFTLIAIPWFVLETTGSATKTGITGFINILRDEELNRKPQVSNLS